MRSWWLPASLGTALAVSLGGACVQVSGLGDITITQNPDGGGGGGDAAVPCTSAAQCDDNDPCTTDACSAQGVCAHTAVADGPAPPSAQTKGTCQKIICVGGAAHSMEDDTNVPTATDMCTTASCMAGKPVMNLAPNGTACMLMGSNGQCMGGVCAVGCRTASDCMNTNSCKTASCDGSKGACVYTNVSDGTPTPGFTQVMGDCTTHVCLSGVDTAAPDPSDLPAKINDCQDPECNPSPLDGGVSGALVPGQSFAKHPADSLCSTYMTNQPGYCDGKGNCDQCGTMNNECSGLINDCQHPACVNGSCTTASTPAGTATTTNPAQTPGDCMKIECDGNGGTMSVTDNTDVPIFPNDCKTGTCTAGVPGHTTNQGMTCPTPTSTSGFVCDSNGNCGCNPTDVPPDCPLPETCGGGGTPMVCGCTPTTCAKQSVTCGTIPDGCFSSLNCNDSKEDGTETDVDCGGATAGCATRCAQGKKCGATSDCMAGLTCADGVCCNTACTGSCQACSAAKKGQGVDGTCGAVKSGLVDPKGTCTSAAATSCGDDNGECDGAGNCLLWPNTTVCTSASCNGTVLRKSATCLNGTCPMQAMQDCTPYRCTVPACPTSCNADTDCATTTYYCTGTNGTCVMKKATGAPCTVNDQCLSGACNAGTGTCS